MEVQTQQASQQKWAEHSGKRNGDRTFPLRPHNVEAKFHPHDKHVQGQPQLRHRVDVALRVAGFGVPGKNGSLQFRKKQAQQGRSQTDPGNHFRHHLRLAEATSHDADDAAGGQNDSDLQEEIFCKQRIFHGQIRQMKLGNGQT